MYAGMLLAQRQVGNRALTDLLESTRGDVPVGDQKPGRRNAQDGPDIARLNDDDSDAAGYAPQPGIAPPALDEGDQAAGYGPEPGIAPDVADAADVVAGQGGGAGAVAQQSLNAAPSVANQAVAGNTNTPPYKPNPYKVPKERQKYKNTVSVDPRYTQEAIWNGHTVDILFCNLLATHLWETYPELQTLIQAGHTERFRHLESLVKNRSLPADMQAICDDRETEKLVLVERMGWNPVDVDRFPPRAQRVQGGDKVGDTLNTRTKMVQDPSERDSFKATGGNPLIWRGKPLSTTGMYSRFAGKDHGIFVMDPGGDLYVGGHQVGLFHHSSFLDAGEAAGAGEISAKDGQVTSLTNKSGHYRPTLTETIQVLNEFKSRSVPLAGTPFTFFDAAGVPHNHPDAEKFRVDNGGQPDADAGADVADNVADLDLGDQDLANLDTAQLVELVNGVAQDAGGAGREYNAPPNAGEVGAPENDPAGPEYNAPPNAAAGADAYGPPPVFVDGNAQQPEKKGFIAKLKRFITAAKKKLGFRKRRP